MSIDWSLEPDLNELRRAEAQLESDPLGALWDLQRLADRGSLASMLYIGHAYEIGRVGQIDLDRAEEWYRRAADGGQSQGAFALGRLYWARGEHAPARLMYERAAMAGYAPSMRALAWRYFYGQGCTRDTAKAKEWWKKAIAEGNILSIRDLGCLSLRGNYGVANILPGARYLISAFWLILQVRKKNPASHRLF